jgi:hypothetical protein
MGDQSVSVDELGAWLDRCKSDKAQMTQLSDDDLSAHYTVMLIVRMLLFSHLPPAAEPSNPVVEGLIDQLEPCLDNAYGEAARRGWEPQVLREAARLVLSPPLGAVVDPVEIFRAG